MPSCGRWKGPAGGLEDGGGGGAVEEQEARGGGAEGEGSSKQGV